METVTLTLPPELEGFAAEAIAAGRYRDVSELVQTGMRLLQRAEAERAALIRSLEEAQAEGVRDGFFTIEEVASGMNDIIEAAERRRG